MMTKICLVNDDGPKITGFMKLVEALSKEYELAIVVPDGQRSATSKSLSLNNPLRITKIQHANIEEFYNHSGTPADSALIADAMIDDIDIFVSGINPGANLGYQSIMTSGTLGAALEAAFLGYPALAVSEVVGSKEWFSGIENNRDYSKICEHVIQIINTIIAKGIPTGIDALNLNFPKVLKKDSFIVITRPTRIRMKNDIENRVDPNGNEYYWIRGEESEPTHGSDAFEVLVNGNISLSPMIIESVRDDDLEELKRFMEI